MPELPEVETIKRQLEGLLFSKSFDEVNVISKKPLSGLDESEFIRAVKGARITGVKRRAKILIIQLSNGFSLLIHLKMTGRLLYMGPNEPVTKHAHIIFSLSDGMTLRFWDMRKFGYVKLAQRELSEIEELKALGPEALELSEEEFVALAKTKRSGRIKQVLMDQNFLAGVGNIYSDEALFLAGINPQRNIATLSDDVLRLLFRAIRQVLLEAIEAKGSSVGDYVDAFGNEGSYVKKHRVYGKFGKSCPRCKAKVDRVRLGGRSAHFCPACQK